jgi:hypothetical protein
MVPSLLRRVINMNTFNESAIASYVKTRAEENCKLMVNDEMNELEKGKILGRMEAYNEFLERFGFDKVEC